ncbi:MAG: amino acid adenylation domain-containing protein, partial [Acidobacteriota bacterium]
LPLTANLKVDRRALLARPLELAAAAEAVAPRDGRERTLAQIYAQLLGRDAVGVHDDFFDLGGHSLLATQVVARIRSAFGVEPPLRVLFENPTVALLAEVLADLGASEGAGRGDDGSDVVVLEGIPTADRSRPLPTSFAQERLWLLDQIETESTAYNLSGALDLRGRLDADALGAAFADLATRHGSLRTTFAEHPEHGGHGVQIVGDGVPTVESVDLRHLQPGDAEAEADRLASQLARTPFDLGRGPLLRLTLARLGDDHHRLIYALHHIVSDGWSMGILIREVSALYAARVSGRDADLPPLPVQYADYAAWERGRLTGETLERQLGYWRDHLAGAPALLELPTDRPRPPVQTFRGDAVDLELSPQLTARLRRLGQGLGDGGNATLFMVLMAAWQALLARLSGQDDIVVGTPIAHRTRAELEGLIGFFANTLVMRTRPDDGTDFLALLAKVRRAALDSYAHQDLPFEKLVAELEVPRNLARSPVFQVLFTLQNAPASGFDLPGLRVEAVEVDRGRAQFDLSLVMVEDDADGGLFGRLEYNADLFDEATAARWLGYYARLLEAVASAPTAPLHRHSLVDDAERGALLETWNDTARELPRDSLHGWIARVADRRPEAVAVAPAPGSAGDALTYGELRSGARRLARHLRSSLRGAGEPIAEAPVGVLLERGPHMVTALLGILEAGAAYLPLDPAYPADRLRYMLESSGATMLVTEGDLAERLGLADVARGIRLDAESAAIAAFDDGPLTEVDVDPSRLAYVLYTSGSTGLPKGVQIPHGALVNFLRSMARAPGLGADDTLLAVTTLSFDIAGLELFLPLSQGGKVLVADRDTAADGLKLKSALEASDATAMQATPATWRMLLEAGWEGRPDLRVLCGGEALPAELARRLNAVGADLWNVYGPTEATVWSTTRPVPAGAESRFGEGSVTLGAPIDNTQTHVVDRRGHLAPTGVPGELLIGGTGLARGYRGRPALTAERFLPDSFSGRPGARLYRTGDLIRRRVSADGGSDLEFLSRLDHQVKVRGFRIELGEIEASLDAHPAVRQGVVTVRQDGPSTRLVAYVVPSADGVDPADLAVHLRTTLPDYMVPAAWVQLDAMPLTPNGKVDRKALPAPEASSTADAEPPEGDAEIGLADIWGEVLGRDGVGRRDNFFALGGDSVLAIQVVTRARGAGWTLEVREIFQHQTLAELAAVARVREPDQDASGQAQTSAAPVRDDGIDILGADLSDDDLDDLLGDIDL